MSQKAITIITAVYNGANDLPKLLDSIRNQTSKNFEFIVIDGASKDETVNIIKSNENIINYWVSEPDRGIYDAWNKGVKAANGQWIMFLGCDDMLMPGAIAQYEKFLNSNICDNIDYISSKMQMIDQTGKEIRVKGWQWEWPKFLQEMTVAHPGSLHSRKYFEKYGLFNPKYKIVGDYELLLRARENLNAAFLDIITVKMQEGGASDSFRAVDEHYKAAITSGGQNKVRASINAYTVKSKLYVKRIFRKAGFNVYLRK